MSAPALVLDLLPDRFAICRLDAGDEIPAWAQRVSPFASVSRTADELSIITAEANVPPQIAAQRGYRILRVRGPLPLDLIGIMASLAAPLAEAHVSIFPIATYDTDWVLLAEADLERGVGALRQAGHRVVENE